jgi:lysozyme
MGQPVNEACVTLVTHFEGLRLTSYQDSVGVWTIGYGHTGANVRAGQTITQDQATQFLEDDLEHAASGVDGCVKVAISANQRGALTSFAYNLGVGNLKSSTLLRLLNSGDYAGAADQFPRWNKAGGQVLAGLVKRRAAERALFLCADPAVPAAPWPTMG